MASCQLLRRSAIRTRLSSICELRPAPARTNPLGVKGVGEAGTTAALAAIMNAVADALPECPEIDMPATPERVWRALHQSAEETR